MNPLSFLNLTESKFVIHIATAMFMSGIKNKSVHHAGFPAILRYVINFRAIVIARLDPAPKVGHSALVTEFRSLNFGH